MKKLILLFAVIFAFTTVRAQEFEGIEQGDKELSFNGMVMAASGFTMGTIFLSGGYYITDKLLVGAAPGVTITTGFGGANANLSLSLFSTYNFFTDKQAFPYVKGTLHQYSFDTEYTSFLSNTFIQAGGGYKIFFTDKIAWDTSATFGINLASPIAASLMLLTGLSFIF